MAGLFVSGAVLLAIEQSASSEQFGYLLLASLPAFAGGITEDATKNVGVLTRLLLTMLAAAFGVWLLGAVIPRLDIPGSIRCSSGRRLRLRSRCSRSAALPTRSTSSTATTAWRLAMR